MAATANQTSERVESLTATRTGSLAQHLGGLIDHLANFRNTVDSPQRQDLLNALRRIQAEAEAQGIETGDSVPATARAILALPSSSRVLESIGIREIPGSGPYEAFDPRWAESMLNYYETGHNRVPFPTAQAGTEPVKPLVAADEITIAIAGDCGADSRVTPPVEIARLISSKQPHYTIHLGDVYYSGTNQEEAQSFLNFWPAGTEGSYTLNSNHEMYCGGTGYFKEVLQHPHFAAQQGLSYFALTNEHWLIIGLDTAYFAYYQSLLYEEGSLFEPDARREPNGLVQLQWLREVLARHSGKRVILLTHHDGFDVNPATRKVSRKPLLQQVSGELSRVRDWWWYFGHVHAPLVYDQIFFSNRSTLSPRCVGHGAVPYQPFPLNFHQLGDSTVRIIWAETDLARNGGNKSRAPNGFALLTLKGGEIKEEIYDELGRQRWSNF